MLIAHLSDLHVSLGPPETGAVRHDARKMAELLVADLCRLPQQPDAVVISGDIADGGTAEDYALVRKILAPLKMPVLVVPGNHDKRAALRAAFAQSHPYQDLPWLCYVRAFAGFRVIGLDSLIEGQTAGRLCDGQLDWLEKTLAQSQDPCFVALHHPPFSSGNRHWDDSALIGGGDRLHAILQAHPVRLLCGHVHQAYHTQWAGGYAAVAGSPAFQYGFGFDESTEPPLIDGPCPYWLHHLRADGGFGVHLRSLVLPPRSDL